MEPDPKRAKSRPGFIEIVVALSIMVSLAGVVMPVIGGDIHDSRMDRAMTDLVSIADGLNAYTRDTLYLPTGPQGRTEVAWLFGPGEMPADIPFTGGGEAAALSDYLIDGQPGGGTWNGPYVHGLRPDPWGRAYLVNVDGWLKANEHAMVLSAGNDGIVQTQPDNWHAVGDDVVFLLD